MSFCGLLADLSPGEWLYIGPKVVPWGGVHCLDTADISHEVQGTGPGIGGSPEDHYGISIGYAEVNLGFEPVSRRLLFNMDID